MAGKNGYYKIEARGVPYKELNEQIKKAAHDGKKKIKLVHVNGQRYIGSNLSDDIEIMIEGIPGNDLGAFMKGPRIVVKGNAQDGIGNTMDKGEIVVHGHAGDIAGYSSRGGRILIRDTVGYRVGIHMKEYMDKAPVIVIGKAAQDFLGEYMAGGVLIVIGIGEKKVDASFVGTGMHGGVIYLGADIRKSQVGKEVGIMDLNDKDRKVLKKHITYFARQFSMDSEELLARKFQKLLPVSSRPYGKLYAY